MLILSLCVLLSDRLLCIFFIVRSTLFWVHSSAHYVKVMNELVWGFDDLWIELIICTSTTIYMIIIEGADSNVIIAETFFIFFSSFFLPELRFIILVYTHMWYERWWFQKANLFCVWWDRIATLFSSFFRPKATLFSSFLDRMLLFYLRDWLEIGSVAWIWFCWKQT